MRPSEIWIASCAAVLFCGAAIAEDGGARRRLVFETGVIGSMPNQTIAGVASGGAPWVVREGHARLRRDGKLNVEVEGLLITAGTLANGSPVPQNLIGTVGPVSMVAASLVCGGMVVGSTHVAPLTVSGDAEMEGRIKAPRSCASPVVLVRIAPSVSAATSELGAFIALSGASVSDDDDGPNHDVGDDHGDDGPNHDVGDYHGNDGGRHSGGRHGGH